MPTATPPTWRRQVGARRARPALGPRSRRGRRRRACPERWPSSSCTRSRCCTTTSWTPTASAITGRPPGRCSGRRGRSWPATPCSRSPSGCCSSPASPHRAAALESLADATARLIDGQAADLDLEGRVDATPQECTAMCAGQDRRPARVRGLDRRGARRRRRRGRRAAARVRRPPRARVPGRRRPARDLGRPGRDGQAGVRRPRRSARPRCRWRSRSPSAGDDARELAALLGRARPGTRRARRRGAPRGIRAAVGRARSPRPRRARARAGRARRRRRSTPRPAPTWPRSPASSPTRDF